jgi:hypothetical protein
METKAGSVKDFEGQFGPEGKTCIQPGCNHPAYISVWWAPGHFNGFMGKCCHRRNLERRLAELTRELERLPAEIAVLPVDCERPSEEPADQGSG